MKKRGFTLIELLVVVLIIGILSAIALPQYTLAVEKSRIAEANMVLKSLVNACERYYLENPGSDTNFCWWNNIDIELNLPESNGGAERQAKYFYYSLETPNTEIYAGRGTNGNEEYYLNYTFAEEFKPSTAVRNCDGVTDFGKKVCKSLCGSDRCNY